MSTNTTKPLNSTTTATNSTTTATNSTTPSNGAYKIPKAVTCTKVSDCGSFGAGGCCMYYEWVSTVKTPTASQLAEQKEWTDAGYVLPTGSTKAQWCYDKTIVDWVEKYDDAKNTFYDPDTGLTEIMYCIGGAKVAATGAIKAMAALSAMAGLIYTSQM